MQTSVSLEVSCLKVLPIKTGRRAAKFRATELKPPSGAAKFVTSTRVSA
jgi:hypothetical protein